MKNYKRLLPEMSTQKLHQAVIKMYYENESLSINNISKKISRELGVSINEVGIILQQSGVLG